jgi:hypothetical protein
MHLI